MTRRLLVAILSVLLRLFFRRIEVEGRENVPPEPRPAIFVLNHPNGLVDPLFILCLAPRRVSFLAKSTIFKMPVLGWIARSIDAIPVYRQQDAGEDPKKNEESFESARQLLARGGTIALFPEGTSHSAPALKPMKTGAARLALGARARLDGLVIVPAGLYYTAKRRFRSAALVCYGAPIEVPSLPLGPDGAPPREAVGALTGRIDEALRSLTLNADLVDALAISSRAERIFSSAPAEAEQRSVARELTLRRRFVEGHARLREEDPAALDALVTRVAAYEDQLAAAGLDPATLAPAAPLFRAVPWAIGRLLLFAVATPLALVGAAVHGAAYHMCGVLAKRFSNDDDDMVATIKMLAALLLFPLTWAACATAAALLAPPGGRAACAIAALVVVPLTGLVAVRYQETLGATAAAVRGFRHAVSRPSFTRALLEERNAIHAEMARLAERLELTSESEKRDESEKGDARP